MNRPAFLKEAIGQSQTISSDVQREFARLSQLIADRSYSTDLETKIALLSRQLGLMLDLVISEIQRRYI